MTSLRRLSSVTVLFFLAAPLTTFADEAPASKWAGLYIGATAGMGIGGNSKSTDLDAFNYFCPGQVDCTPIAGEVTDVGTDSGFIGGGQIGFNYAIDQKWIIGVEADFSTFDFSASRTPASSKADWGADTLVIVGMDWLATVRGRLGYAMDHWLIYGTGGVAFTDGEYRNYDFCSAVPCGRGLMDARGDMGTGWTVGGGLELALSTNWTAKAEYQFVRFEGEEYAGRAYNPENGNTNGFFGFSASPAEFNIIRLGMNYRFGDLINDR